MGDWSIWDWMSFGADLSIIVTGALVSVLVALSLWDILTERHEAPPRRPK